MLRYHGRDRDPLPDPGRVQHVAELMAFSAEAVHRSLDQDHDNAVALKEYGIYFGASVSGSVGHLGAHG